MTVCLCVRPVTAQACRGGGGPPGFSRRSARGNKEHHIAMSNLTVGHNGATHQKLCGYCQHASDTGDTHAHEYLETHIHTPGNTSSNILQCCKHIIDKHTNKTF